MLPIQCRMIRRGCCLLTSNFISQTSQAASISISRNLFEKRNIDPNNPETLFQPVSIPANKNPDDINVGAELTTKLNKSDILRIINNFMQKKEVKDLARTQGLDNYLLQDAFNSFRKFCVDSHNLPTDLHIIFSDVVQGSGHVTDIFPFFMRHAREVFPHLDCLDDLKKISDLTTPPNWYPNARALERKIIFHAGPTNSGKTYHALNRFMEAKSGVYCGPLKLLAVEVYQKSNKNGTPCDLVTGEDRKYAQESGPSEHVSCTVEMVPLQKQVEVAVIDEIQMLQDPGRGWAWTRALLGLPAKEIHVCGEAGALDLIRTLCISCGETVETNKYERLTPLEVQDEAIVTLQNVKPGDCIVCFNKMDIYTLTKLLEKQGTEVAVIYGSLPPGTKLAQAAKFNDPEDPCKVLIATDAIGMGLNLHIQRVIFYSLIKPMVNEKGEKEMDLISVSQALQIAGRAGRFRTQWEKGYVTTFKKEDLPTLKNLLSQSPEPLNQAGLHPTADQIELYAYHLPKAPLSNLMDIFVSLCTVNNEMYFMCQIDDFKFLADMIEHVPLPLRARYAFCCAPINRKMSFVCSMFLKFTRQYCKNEPITFHWLSTNVGWPIKPPKNLIELAHAESVFDVLDLYLWLSYRFSDLFPDVDVVRDMQKELDSIIQMGLRHLAMLIKGSEMRTGGVVDLAEVLQAEELEPKIEEKSDDTGIDEELGKTSVGKGKLTERLLAEGLLTPRMLKELQQEWAKAGGKELEDSKQRGRKSKKKD